MVPVHTMHNITLPKDSTGTKIYVKLHFIEYQEKVLWEPSETILYLFGPLKSSGSHSFAHTYQI